MNLKDLLESTRMKLVDHVDEKFLRLMQHHESVEKHLSLGIEKNQKEIERLKYDLIDILENKH